MTMRLLQAGLCVGAVACSSGGQGTSAPPATQTYDVDALGIPRFVADNYLDLGMIDQISRFRSSVGHDYHDQFELCRSMKHYFPPRSTVDWATVPIYAPVTGTIVLSRAEALGIQLVMRSSVQPAFTFTIFHLNPTTAVTAGTTVTRGAQLGWHVGAQTMSDIAVGVDTPAGYRLLSWFEVITRTERDLDPLTCAGETFTSAGALANWLTLN